MKALGKKIAWAAVPRWKLKHGNHFYAKSKKIMDSAKMRTGWEEDFEGKRE